MLYLNKKSLYKKSCKGLVLKTGLEPVRPNGHWILSPTCLPIPPLQLTLATLSNQNWYILRKFQSERRDLNPRPPPWQGDALPLSYFRSLLMNIQYRYCGCKFKIFLLKPKPFNEINKNNFRLVFS